MAKPLMLKIKSGFGWEDMGSDLVFDLQGNLLCKLYLSDLDETYDEHLRRDHDGDHWLLPASDVLRMIQLGIVANLAGEDSRLAQAADRIAMLMLEHEIR